MSMLTMLGLLGAGVVSSGASVYANKQNIENQLKINAWAQELADSAHQREVMDLYKAGLNPVLSASGSGAQVPSLGTAEVVNAGQGIADGINSASNLMSSQYKAQVANLKANTEKVNAESSAVHVHNDLVQQQSENEQIRRDILKADRLSHQASSFSNSLREAAYQEAITGNRPNSPNMLIDWNDKGAVKTYENLVQRFRNQIELERYLNSRERQMVLDGVSTANDLNELKGTKKTIEHIHKKGGR